MDDPSLAALSLSLGAPSSPATTVVASARAVDGFGTDIDATLAWVRAVGADLVAAPTTRDRWEALAASASVDVAGARMLEPHLDALSILEQAATVAEAPRLAGVAAGPGAIWGVFAAEAPGVQLRAREANGRWTLSGTKPWCSLAAHLSHALVTAWTGPDERQLFAVDLQGSTVSPHAGPWVSRGLAQVVSAPVDFDETAAVPVGEPGWYLRRHGFAWGGVGVAAVWWGASLPIRDAVVEAAAREDADQLAAVFAGEADAATWAARGALADAAARADEDALDPAPEIVAHRTRAIVSYAAELVLSSADRALGPAPLTTDEAFARRIADLRIYLRQHHAERDLARLGRKLGTR